MNLYGKGNNEYKGLVKTHENKREGFLYLKKLNSSSLNGMGKVLDKKYYCITQIQHQDKK